MRDSAALFFGEFNPLIDFINTVWPRSNSLNSYSAKRFSACPNHYTQKANIILGLRYLMSVQFTAMNE